MSGIVFDDVSFTYDESSLLDNISITIEKGDFVLVVGPNGAGKTTFLKLAAGLLTPNCGDIRILGKSVKECQLAGDIHLVPQLYNKNTEQFPATVSEIVGMGLTSVPVTERKERIAQALHDVGMSAYEHRRIGALSGGQQQRVMLAQALVRRTKVLYLDEPTSGIDFQASAQIFSLLSELNKKHGITIVMVTHNIAAATNYAKKIICINHDICYYGNCDGFMESHLHTTLAWHIGG